MVLWAPGGIHMGFFVIEMDLRKECRKTIAYNLGRKDIKNLGTILTKKVRVGFFFKVICSNYLCYNC